MISRNDHGLICLDRRSAGIDYGDVGDDDLVGEFCPTANDVSNRKEQIQHARADKRGVGMWKRLHGLCFGRHLATSLNLGWFE